MVKTGTRLRSQVCDTQVIVIKTGDGLDDLRAGGIPMRPLGTQADTEHVLNPDFAGGNVLGKRYVNESGVEVLVTKAGAGTLSIGDLPMTIKEAKPLPASD